MSTFLRSVLILFALLGAAQSASAYPEHTIYVDTSHLGSTDSGIIEADCDEADRNAR